MQTPASPFDWQQSVQSPAVYQAEHRAVQSLGSLEPVHLRPAASVAAEQSYSADSYSSSEVLHTPEPRLAPWNSKISLASSSPALARAAVTWNPGLQGASGTDLPARRTTGPAVTAFASHSPIPTSLHAQASLEADSDHIILVASSDDGDVSEHQPLLAQPHSTAGGSDDAPASGQPPAASTSAGATSAAAGGNQLTGRAGPQRTESLLADLDVEVDVAPATAAPWRQQIFSLLWRGWWVSLPWVLTASLALAAALLYFLKPPVVIMYLAAWRWALFLAGIIPLQRLSDSAMRLAVIVVESRFFTSHQALYFVVGVRKSAARLVLAVLLLPWFAVAFQETTEVHSQQVETADLIWAYKTLMKVLVCIVLFSLAGVLSMLLTKVVASSFHRRAHFQKMEDALNKEYFLLALSQPREEEEEQHDAVEDEVLMSQTVQASSRSFSGLAQGLTRSRGARRASLDSTVGAAAATTLTKTLLDNPGSIEISPEKQPRRGPKTLDPGPGRKHSVAGALAELHDSVAGALKAAEERFTKTFNASQLGLPMRIASENFSRLLHPQLPRSRRPRLARADTTAGELQHSELNPSASQTPQPPPGGARSGAGAMAAGLAKGSFAGQQAVRASGTSTPRNAAGATLKAAAGKSLQEAAELAAPSEQTDAAFMARLHRVEQHIRTNKLKVTFTDQIGAAAANSDGDELNSAKEAKRLAFYLFWNIRADVDRNHVTLEDLEYFLPGSQAEAALKVLDTNGDGRVSLHDIRDAVVLIYKERKNLAFTLKDTKTVVGQLEVIFALLLHSLFALLYLLIFEADVSKVWLTFSSCLLGFVFVFGNNIRSIYESIIFLFVVHPFDVGDVLLLEDKNWVKVEEMALMNTVFVRWDGTKIWYPNTRLASDAIFNVARSNNRWEGFKMSVDISTPAAVFEGVQKDVDAHFKAHPSEYTGERVVVSNFAGDPMKFMLCVWWEYSHPGMELARMSKARHALYMAVATSLARQGVTYTLPPYQGMEALGGALQGHAPYLERPRGEGQPFMPPFLTKAALKL